MSETGGRASALSLFIASAPLRCAAIVLAAVAGAQGLFVYLFAQPDLIAHTLHDPAERLESIGGIATSIAATLSAFRMHVRGHTPAWRAIPLVLFAAWQAVTVYNCLEVPLDKPTEQLLYGHSPECFLFILAASIPLALILFPLLYLHKAELGWSASAMTGLAISSLSGLLLHFFHNFALNIGDWSIHMLAMGIVVGSCAYVGQVLPSR